MKDIVLSGVRPTGRTHLGNYYGAIVNFVKMQEEYENTFFFIADFHTFTTQKDAAVLPKQIRNVLATYLAAGLDPDKAAIYLQSDLPQIPELYLLLNMISYKGELEKVPTFKEKIREQKSINAGLLTYPVLMAADILIHRSHKVPVGKDQQQHLELTRNLAQRFNHTFGEEWFPEPQAFNYNTELLKILSLDGSGGKMSKSDANQNNAIYLDDEDDVILKKIKKAKTDTGPTEPNSSTEPVDHLFGLMELVSTPEVLADYKKQYADCSIKYGYFKLQIAEDLTKVIAPIRERIKELEQDTDLLSKVVKRGGEQARESAEATMKGVRRLMGINYF